MPKPFTPGRPYWWQCLTVLSLDAPLVAVVWQALFARVLRVDLPWYQPLLLGLAVWVVYVADRWIEGWRLSPERVKTQRHHFYISWRWSVFWLGLAVILAALGIAAVCLPTREWAASVVLAVPTGIYLLSHQLLHRHHPWRVPKEFCIAAIFPLGTALGPVAAALPGGINWHFIGEAFDGRLAALWLPLGLFGLLCLANLALISAWEAEVDVSHGQTSIALQFPRGVPLIHALPWLLLAAGLGVAVGSGGVERIAGLCLAASAALLVALDYLEPRIGRQAARAFVDLALLTPAVGLLFA